MKPLSSSYLVFVAALTLLKTEAQVSLETLDTSQNSFICGELQVLICTIESYTSMTWTKDTFPDPLAFCSFSICDVNPSMSASYDFTFDTNNGTFQMKILTVKVSDNGTTYSCGDGFMPENIVADVKVEDDFRIVNDSKKIDSNTTEISLTTGCIQNNVAEGVKFEWWLQEVNNTSSEKRKINESKSDTIYGSSVCIANPDCGVSGYSFITNSVNITEEGVGKNYSIGVDVKSGNTLINSLLFDLIFTLNFPVSEEKPICLCWKSILVMFFINSIPEILMCLYRQSQLSSSVKYAGNPKFSKATFGISLCFGIPILGLILKAVFCFIGIIPVLTVADCQKKLKKGLLILFSIISLVSEALIYGICKVLCVCQWYALCIVVSDLLFRWIVYNKILLSYSDTDKTYQIQEKTAPPDGRSFFFCMAIFKENKDDHLTGNTSHNVSHHTKTGKSENQTKKFVRNKNHTQETVKSVKHTQETVKSVKHTQETENSGKHTQDNVKNANYTQENVKSANHTQETETNAKEPQENVKNATHTQENAKNANHTQEHVNNVKQSQESVKNDNRTKKPVKIANHTQESVQNANYTQENVENANDTEVYVKNANHTVVTVKSADHTQKSVKSANYTQETEKNANHTQENVKNANHTQGHVNSVKHTQESVKSTVTSANDTQESVINANHIQESVKKGNHTQESVENANHTKVSVKSANHTQENVKSANHTQETLNSVKHTQETVKNENRTQENVKNANHIQESVNNANHTQESVENANHTKVSVKSANHTQKDVKSANHIQKIVNSVIHTQKAVKSANNTQETVKIANHTQENVKNANYTQENVKNADHTQESVKNANQIMISRPESHESSKSNMMTRGISAGIIADENDDMTN